MRCTLQFTICSLVNSDKSQHMLKAELHASIPIWLYFVFTSSLKFYKVVYEKTKRSHNSPWQRQNYKLLILPKDILEWIKTLIILQRMICKHHINQGYISTDDTTLTSLFNSIFHLKLLSSYHAGCLRCNKGLCSSPSSNQHHWQTWMLQ